MNRVCFIFEDVTAGVGKQVDLQSPGGMSAIAESAFMGQRLNIGIILCVHSLSSISAIIKDNIEVWICFGQSGESPSLISNTICTSREQSEILKGLQPGWFVMYNPALYEKPVLAYFDRVEIPKPIEEHKRRERVEKFLSNVKSAPAYISASAAQSQSEKSKSKKETTASKSPALELSDRCLKFLVILAGSLPAAVTDFYSRMNLSSAQGRRVIKELEKLGFVRCFWLSTGKRGGKISLVCITDAGWEFLQSKNITRPAAMTNGGILHEAAARLIHADGKASGCKVFTEPVFKGFRADLMFIHPQTGIREIVNIGISDPVREAQNIMKFFGLASSKSCEFTFVAGQSKFNKVVRENLAKADTSKQLADKVVFKLIADYL